MLKRWIGMILMMVMLLGGMPELVLAAEPYQVRAEVSNNQIGVTVTAADPAADSQSQLIVGVYDAMGALLNCRVEPLAFGEGTIYQLAQPIKYGKDAKSYKAFVWSGLDSLLPRSAVAADKLYFETVKLRGTVVENMLTDLQDPRVIDTSQPETVKLLVTEAPSGVSYQAGETYTFGVGDSGARGFLGYNVDVDVSLPEDGKLDEIISIAKTEGKNNEISFMLSQFDSFDGQALAYMKESTDAAATRLNVCDEWDKLSIIYNNIASADSMEQWFGRLIVKNNCMSGKVTVLDNDDDPEYDVVFIQIDATGVVDEISTRGEITFKNEVGSRYTNNIVRKINYGAGTDTFIQLTKGGQPYDYKKLQRGDVLSVVTNNESEAYDIKVITDLAVSGKITGRMNSDSSASGYAYVIEGKAYDIAEGCYPLSSLKTDLSGIFYINEFGKIAAFEIEAEPRRYAYVLSSETQEEAGNTLKAVLKVLNRDGSVSNLEFAPHVMIENLGYNPEVRAMFPQSVIPSDFYEDDVLSIKIMDNTASEMTQMVSALRGQLITYETPDNPNEVKVITVAARQGLTWDDASTLTFSGARHGMYNWRYQSFDYADVNDNTLAFFIRGEGDIGLYDTADEELSSVAPISKIASGEYDYVLYDIDDFGCASAVVLYNTAPVENPDPGPTSKPSEPVPGIACITQIETVAVDGIQLHEVTFYQDGDLITSRTAPDMTGDCLDETVAPGSVYMFTFENDTIQSAQKLLTFDLSGGNGLLRDRILPGTATVAGLPKIDFVASNQGEDEFYFGPVLKRVSSSWATIAPVVDPKGLEALIQTKDYDSLVLENINLGISGSHFYIYDPQMEQNQQFNIGAAADINSMKGANSDFFNTRCNIVDAVTRKMLSPTPAYGMMDYVFVRKHNHRVQEVVVYLAYEYDYDLEDKT